MVRLSSRITLLGTGVAGLSLVLVSASPGGTTATPSRTFGASAQRANHWNGQRRPMQRPGRTFTTPTPCPSQTSPSVAYFTGSNNQAGGQYSLAAGVNNKACGPDTSVMGGYGNSTDTNTDSFIGGGEDNYVTGAAFVGAGYLNYAEGFDSFVGAGGGEYFTNSSGGTTYGNKAIGEDSFVGAGDMNAINADGGGSFIGGGGYTSASNGEYVGNSITGADSFIGAGNENYVDPSSLSAFVGAGSSNVAGGANVFVGAGSENLASGSNSFVGAGAENLATAFSSFIGSGGLNTIGSGANYSTVSGGLQNTVSGGGYASIIGGYGNAAKGAYATVAGGFSNTAAGELSFAAGYHADAVNNGSFVWSDYTAGSALLKDSAKNEFLARATGGVYFYSNEGATTGVKLAPGEGAWASASDRNAKTDIVPIDDASVLAKVAALPIDAWSYKSDRGVRHLGPMAQDFFAAFGTGVDDLHITSIDEDGVALAAIKALHTENEMLRSQYRAQSGVLEGRLSALAAKNAELERRLDALAARI
jgi:hypothetical protein